MNLLQKDKTIRGIEKDLTRRVLSRADRDIPDATERRNWRERIEAASAGRNSVLYNDANMPGIYVRVPSVDTALLDDQFGRGVHPAFIVNGKGLPDMWIGKYQGFAATKAGTNYMLSLRGVKPTVNINFDQSDAQCGNNGNGFHVMTTAEWAFIFLWSYMQDWEARGNTEYGHAFQRTDEHARLGNPDGDITATGTGPISWSHDGSPFGIFDMVGNVYEWSAGLRLVNGEIQVIADNDAADTATDLSGSGPWKAILEDGSLVAPGTSGALKYDATSTTGGVIELDTNIDNVESGSNYAQNYFADMQVASGVSVPDIAKLLQIFPHHTDIPTGHYYARNQYAERLPDRGGYWFNRRNAGLASCNLNNGRGSSNAGVGCRPAYVSL